MTSVAEVASEKSYESNFIHEKDRRASGAELGMSLIPGGKIKGATVKAIEKAAVLDANKAAGKAFEKDIVKGLGKENSTVTEQLTFKTERVLKPGVK